MGHILDFAIRKDTNNQKSLDDWMRLMYSRYALPKPGFQPDDAIKAASEVAGTDLSSMFHKYISGKEPIPYEEYFAYAGISVEKKLDPEKAWLGVSQSKSDDGHTKINNVIPGSSADKAGLDRDDIVIGIDGRSVDEDSFSEAILGAQTGRHAANDSDSAGPCEGNSGDVDRQSLSDLHFEADGESSRRNSRRFTIVGWESNKSLFDGGKTRTAR